MSLSPKREGVCTTHTPIPKLTGLPQSNSGGAISQHVCRHGATRLERLPANYPHYAREVCARCGRFLRWLPRPETVERRTLNAFKLARLAMCETLSKWERQFIRDVSQRRKVSPKQQAIVDRLAAQYLEAQT
jgi:hypothetical protein